MCIWCENSKPIAFGTFTVNGKSNNISVYMTRSKNTDHILQVIGITAGESQIISTVKLNYCPFCGDRLCRTPIFPEITSETAQAIYYRPQDAPKECFWVKEEARYLAIDNRTNKCITHDFATKEECLAWFMRE